MKLYNLIWDFFEKKYPLPRKSRNIIEMEFLDFERIISNDNEFEIRKLIENLYFGDFYLIKNAFNKSFLNRIKKDCFNHFLGMPSSFYKMLEGTPDFQRKNDLDTGKTRFSSSNCSVTISNIFRRKLRCLRLLISFENITSSFHRKM